VAITEEDAMSASVMIEEERGTFEGRRHPHNGYYAGDFSHLPFQPLVVDTGCSTTGGQHVVTRASVLGPRHSETRRLA
jgi:hypothetical protein